MHKQECTNRNAKTIKWNFFGLVQFQILYQKMTVSIIRVHPSKPSELVQTGENLGAPGVDAGIPGPPWDPTDKYWVKPEGKHHHFAGN